MLEGWANNLLTIIFHRLILRQLKVCLLIIILCNTYIALVVMLVLLHMRRTNAAMLDKCAEQPMLYSDLSYLLYW